MRDWLGMDALPHDRPTQMLAHSATGRATDGATDGATDDRQDAVAFALHLSAAAAVMAEITEARRMGLPWSRTGDGGLLIATLAPDGYNLVVRHGPCRAVRVQLPDARPLLSGRAMLGAGEGPDALSQQLFGGPVAIHPGSTAAVLRQEVFTTAQAIAFAGAPAGGTMRIMTGLAGSTVSLYVTHPTLILQQSRVVLRSTEEGRKTIKMEEFFLADDAPAGTGLRAFARMVRAGQAAGFVAIDTVAVGAARSDRNGYYTWPRFGFDAVLAPLVAERAGACDLLTLMATPEGRDWWRLNGGAVEARFDLLPGSRSLAVLDQYMREKGARV